MTAVPRLLTPSRVMRDLAMVAALVTLVLLGLDTSFATREYLVVGAFGCLAALIAAVTISGLGKNTEVFLLVFPLTYLVLGPVVALREGQPLGVPTPTRIREFLAAMITGPSDFLTTVVPVDAAGGVMVLPFTLGFVAAAISGWLALHTDRRVTPVLPLVAALAASALLGTAEPRWLILRGVAFAVLVLLWIALRSGDAAEVRHAHRGRWLRTGGVIVLVAALASGLSLLDLHVDSDGDATGAGRVVLRGQVGSGEDVTRADNPLADFRRYTARPPILGESVYDVPLLRVSGLDRGARLRFAALDLYDSTHWTAGNRTVAGDDDALFQRIGSVITAPPGREVRVNVEVLRGYASNWLPTAGDLTSLTFDYSDRDAQLADVRYNLATNSAYVRGGIDKGDDYTFTAVLPDDRLTGRAAAYRAGDQLQPTGRFMDLFLFAWFETEAGPMQRVRSVARYLRDHGFYSDGVAETERHVRAGHDRQRIGKEFVAADAIVGNDEQYAATMALLANRLTVPARVVVGATVPGDGLIRGRDVSAWVEVRIADGSWRTLETTTFMPQRPLPLRPDVVVRPEEYLGSEDGSVSGSPQERGQEVEPGRRAPGDTAPERPRSPWWVLLAVLAPLGLPFYKWARGQWARRRRVGRVGSHVLGWRELMRVARDLGHDVPSSFARPEQARLLGLDPALASEVDRVVFAPAEDEDGLAHDFWAEVDRAKSELRSKVSWWRRVRAPFSLRSLRAR